MNTNYDLAIIGSGPGGYAAALTAARRGLHVCLIEREQWGGVCLNVGCIPTKALVAVAHFVRRIRRAQQMGVTVQGCTVDYGAVRARNERIVTTLRRGLTELLTREHIELVVGTARFADAKTLLIERDGATQSLHAQRIVIAVGGRPIAGPWTFDEERILSYRGLLACPALPVSLLVIGGGVIGCEFASLFSALGSAVTLVEQQAQLLPAEDPEVVRWLTRRLTSDGVTVLTGATVQRLQRTVHGVEAVLSDGTTRQAQRCVVAIGQRPNIDSLQLDAAGIAVDQGVRVDAFLRTSQPHVAAIGDCVAGHGLAHWASAEGVVAVPNLLGEPMQSVDPNEVPWCVFTEPEIARIGPLESTLGDRVRASRLSFSALGKSHCDDETEGFVKLLVDAATDRILGATIIGAQASTVIHQVALAMRHGMTARHVARTITAHPTLSESVTEAAAHLYGESLVAASRSRHRPVVP